MKILMLGDVMGRAGRDILNGELPGLREKLGIDFVLVNGENSAGGFGITGEICRSFYQSGEGDAKLLRPANYPPGTPGRGHGLFQIADGRKVLVIQVMCRLFMDAIDDPFASVKTLLEPYRLGASVDAIIVDIHGEASSEKQALARFIDGRVSLAAGTHTHVPTADHMILPGGTAFMTDVGMCGAYNSIIGMEIAPIVERFTRKMRGERFTPVLDDATLAAIYVETDDATGLAKSVSPVRIGGVLEDVMPA